MYLYCAANKLGRFGMDCGFPLSFCLSFFEKKNLIKTIFFIKHLKCRILTYVMILLQWLKKNGTVHPSTLELSTLPISIIFLYRKYKSLDLLFFSNLGKGKLLQAWGYKLTTNTNYSRNEYFFARKKIKSFKIIA